MDFNDIPYEIQACIFKDYSGQRCICKKLNDYNEQHYLDYVFTVPISKNEVYCYFQTQPDYMIVFFGNSCYIYKNKLDNYHLFLHGCYRKESKYVGNISKVVYDVEVIDDNVYYTDVYFTDNQYFDLSTTFHILSKRLKNNIDYDYYDLYIKRDRMIKTRMTDYVLKLYHQYIYDIKLENINDYLLLCKMINYVNFNIEMLSCEQSIDCDEIDESLETFFYEGKIDDENRSEIENLYDYHLKARELLLMKINQFLF